MATKRKKRIVPVITTMRLPPDVIEKVDARADAEGISRTQIVIGLIREKLEAGTGAGFIFDGFPRTLQQADALEDLLSGMGHQIDAVIEMQVDDAALVDRISGRFTCGSCGSVYHDLTRPTERPGICDVCGSTDLRRRGDDNAESLKTRLLEYYKKTSPLIGYYYAKGKLRPVNGLADVADVAAQIASHLPSVPGSGADNELTEGGGSTTAQSLA